jgi:hypothetical protein
MTMFRAVDDLAISKMLEPVWRICCMGAFISYPPITLDNGLRCVSTGVVPSYI